MCIPPISSDPNSVFSLMKIKIKFGLNELSMGMSSIIQKVRKSQHLLEQDQEFLTKKLRNFDFSILFINFNKINKSFFKAIHHSTFIIFCQMNKYCTTFT